MGLVSTWLTGCGLSHAIPNFTAAGIVTPTALAELDLAHYEALGVSNPEDRRKLFYLVQRIKLAVEKERKENADSDNDNNDNNNNGGAGAIASLEEQVDALVSATTTTAPAVAGASLSPASPSKENESPHGDKQAHGQPTRQDREMVRKPSKLQVPSSSSPSKSGISPPRSGGGTSPPRSAIPAPSPKRSSPPSKLSPPKTTSPGQTTAPSTNKFSKTAATTATAKKDSSSSDAEIDGSSTWEDGEEDECADDESSIAVTKTKTAPPPAACRRSKRIAEKGTKAAPTIAATVRNTNNHTNKRSISPKKRTLTKPKIAASGLKTPQTKSRVGSSLPRPATRSTRSQLQNPSKSLRTGKPLSTVPADSIPAMSPLPTRAPPQLEASNDDDNNNNKASSNKKSGIVSTKATAKSKSRRSSLSGSVSDHSDSEGSRSGRRNRRTTMGATTSNRSNGSLSDSDNSSSSRRRRKTMGRLAAPKTKTSIGSRRLSDIGGKTNKSSSSRSITTNNNSAGKKTTTTKSKKTIHGGGSETESSWKAQIAALRQEVNLDHELFSDDMVFQDNDDGDDGDQLIRVIVRKRPFSEEKPSDIDVIHPLEYGYYGKMLVYQPNTRVDLTKEINTVPFAFDGVFGEQYNNLQIYQKSVRQLIPVVLEGQHSTVFAFGCTGSGKTHTMMGSNFTGKKIVEEENMGLYYMAALDLFSYLDESEYSHLSVGVSLFEIYGGKLYDLLNDRKAVKCLEDHKGKVQFPGLSEHRIGSPGELIEYIELGALSRSTGTTSRNADSSRSHAVLQLHLRKAVGRKPNVEHGRLTFIDLAGSERGADTASYSRATRLEGAEINTSLLALKEVIRARARGGSMTHVPFRGSKLTQVLKESFVGENNRCLMIACIAPDMDSCEQTLNTLRYADRVKERNADSGALPSKFKRGGRRRTNAMTRSNASISSLASISDQSIPSYDRRTKKANLPKSQESFEEDSFSDNKSSLKESGAEINTTKRIATRSATASRPFPNGEVSQTTTSSNQTISPAVSEEDETDALLTAVLSEDCTVLVSEEETEGTQTSDLVSELVATHESFLSAVLGMVQDEINLVLKMSIDPTQLDSYGPQLESMLQNQSSLISDLRECFQTYESIQATEIGEQLKNHRCVLTSILNIVKEELALASELDSDNSESDTMVELIESLQQNKLSQISELQACFSSSEENTAPDSTAPHTSESKESASELLLSESFIDDGNDDNLSDASFEDLRL